MEKKEWSVDKIYTAFDLGAVQSWFGEYLAYTIKSKICYEEVHLTPSLKNAILFALEVSEDITALKIIRKRVKADTKMRLKKTG